MNLIDYIILGVLLIVVVLVIILLIKNKKHDCSCCSHSDTCPFKNIKK